MKQRTLAMMTGFEQYTRKARRAIFLEEMCALVAPHYPKPGRAAAGGSGAHAADLLFAAVVQPVGPGGGRGAVRLRGMRQFVGIDLGCEPVPDETTVCKFRHLLEEHQLGEQIL